MLTIAYAGVDLPLRISLLSQWPKANDFLKLTMIIYKLNAYDGPIVSDNQTLTVVQR